MDKRTMEMAFERIVEIDRRARAQLVAAKAQGERQQEAEHQALAALETQTLRAARLKAEAEGEAKLSAAQAAVAQMTKHAEHQLDSQWTYYLKHRDGLASALFEELFGCQPILPDRRRGGGR